MNIKIYLFISLSIALIGNIKAQSSYQVGILPAINLNKKLENDWKINLKLESRQLLKEGVFSEEDNGNYKYILTDIALVTSKKVGLNNALAGGYLIRFRDEKVFHRTIQQFTLTRRYPGLRFAQRFSADQTFTKNEATTFRLRYRLGVEIPLNGQSLDPREFYLKITNEYLGSLEDSSSDLEIRFVPLLGYEFTDNNKLEAGLDYRLDSFIDDNARQRFWGSVSWYLAF